MAVQEVFLEQGATHAACNDASSRLARPRRSSGPLLSWTNLTVGLISMSRSTERLLARRFRRSLSGSAETTL